MFGIKLGAPPIGSLPRTLPLRPIWPGFAVNTLFYAAVLWLLIPGPFALRRFIRRDAGQWTKPPAVFTQEQGVESPGITDFLIEIGNWG